MEKLHFGILTLEYKTIVKINKLQLYSETLINIIMVSKKKGKSQKIYNDSFDIYVK